MLTYLPARLKILESFRGISIILVICFHLFVRFSSSYDNHTTYPYDNAMSGVLIFRYGYMGVSLFFMISGFVITMTLQSCNSLKEFMIKRLIRLWPTLLACSLLTFLIVNALPIKGISAEPHYFLPTLTLTEPRLWTRLLHFRTMEFIDGAAWSLICEMNFYLTIAPLFFFQKKMFYRNWLVYALSVTGIALICKIFSLNKGIYYLNLTLFPSQLPFFALGIYFYLLYSKQHIKFIGHLGILLLLCVKFLYLENIVQATFIGFFITLFVIFIFKNKWLRWLENQVLTKIGVLSYALYLLHQNAGLALLNKFSILFHSTSIWATAVPALASVAIIAYLLEKLICKRVTPWLKIKLL